MLYIEKDRKMCRLTSVELLLLYKKFPTLSTLKMVWREEKKERKNVLWRGEICLSN